jgi:hypothetical protein
MQGELEEKNEEQYRGRKKRAHIVFYVPFGFPVKIYALNRAWISTVKDKQLLA